MERTIHLSAAERVLNLPEPIVEALIGGRLSHAVLLVGTAVRTREAARFIAQTLLCEGSEQPCGVCSACIQFEADVQTDFYELGGTSIKTGEVEALQSWLSMRGHSGKKVYTLYGADSMTGVAANRILKTLEEPQPNVFALLTSISRQAVLSTIRSRCFTYTIDEVGPLSQADAQVIPVLQAATSEMAGTENSSFDGFIDKMIKWTEMWLVERSSALILAAKWQSYCSEVSAEDSLTLLVEWFRDLLHTRVGMSSTRFHAWDSQAQRISPILEVKEWTRAIEVILDSRQRLKSHVGSTLNLEQMCIRLREVIT